MKPFCEGSKGNNLLHWVESNKTVQVNKTTWSAPLKGTDSLVTGGGATSNERLIGSVVYSGEIVLLQQQQLRRLNKDHNCSLAKLQ